MSASFTASAGVWVFRPTLFAFSIAQAQTSAKQQNFEKDMQELLNERSAIQTDFARQHDFENDLVEEIELVEEIKTDIKRL